MTACWSTAPSFLFVIGLVILATETNMQLANITPANFTMCTVNHRIIVQAHKIKVRGHPSGETCWAGVEQLDMDITARN